MNIKLKHVCISISIFILGSCSSIPEQNQTDIIDIYKVFDRSCKGSSVQITECKAIAFIEFVRGNFYKISNDEIAFVQWKNEANADLLYTARKYSGESVFKNYPINIDIAVDPKFIETVTMSNKKHGVYKFGGQDKSNTELSELKFRPAKKEELNLYKMEYPGSD